MRKGWSILLSTLLFLSACTPSAPSNDATTETPSVNVSEAPSATVTSVVPVSMLNVQKEALRGVQINAWYPYHGAEASLFESQVQQFNKQNEWGITVIPHGKENFNELFLQTDAALQGTNYPQVVIALPEHALGWHEYVIDLNPYLNDTVFGMNALDRADFANVIWMQDEVDGVRYGVPAQRSARFLLYNQTWARELGFSSPPEKA